MLDADFLPQVPAPAPQSLPQLDRAWHMTQQLRWPPNASISFETLGLPVSDVKVLVGSQWACIYTQDPMATEAIHPQIMMLVAFALEKLGEELSKRDKEERDAAKQEATEALAKRRKCL